MGKRGWLYGACFGAVLLLGMSGAPRYIEELRVGGGYGDDDGGLDIEANGDVCTDGGILAEGDFITRGHLTAGTAGHVLTTDAGLLDGGKLVDDSVTDTKVSDALTVGSTGSVDAGAIDIPAAQNEAVADNADTVVIHDASAGATREMTRQDFLTGVDGLWSDAGDYIAPKNAAGVHIEDDGDVVTSGALDIESGPVSIGTASGDTYLMKAQFEGSEILTLKDRSAFEGHIIWSEGSHSMSNIHGVVGRAGVGTNYSSSSTEVIGVRGLAVTGPVFSQIYRGIGLKGQVVLNQSGTISDGVAIYGGTAGSVGSVSNLYGLYVEDITKGSTSNYAVYTGLGACRFGDDVTIAGDLEVQGGSLVSPGDFAVSANGGSGAVTVSGALSTPAVVTFSVNDTTPSVAGANIFRVPNTWSAGNDITNLDDGAAGQTVTVVGGDADCVFTDNANLQLSGTWTAEPSDTLVLIHVDGAWYEVSRSDN